MVLHCYFNLYLKFAFPWSNIFTYALTTDIFLWTVYSFYPFFCKIAELFLIDSYGLFIKT